MYPNIQKAMTRNLKKSQKLVVFVGPVLFLYLFWWIWYSNGKVIDENNRGMLLLFAGMAVFLILSIPLGQWSQRKVMRRQFSRFSEAELERIKAKRAFQDEIADKNRRLKAGAYEDFREGLISREDYKSFTEQFDRQIREAMEAITQLDRETNNITDGLAKQQGWLSQFAQYENIQELSRNIVVTLVDHIEIREDKDIDVCLLHRDHFASIIAFLNEQRLQADTKIIPVGMEAV